MKKTPLSALILFITCLCLSGRAAMTIQSLSGAVTATEISSYKTFMQGRTPPTTNTYDNNMADGTAGTDCESLGLMYEVSHDTQLLDKMIQYADAFLSLRNDFTDRRVMWDGNVDPVWLTKAAGTSQAGYAGCENNDIAGHIAYCAKLILQTPSIWNTPAAVGDPHGYGATYLQRAQTYVTQMEIVQDNYMTVWFIDSTTKRIKDSSTVDPAFAALGQSTTAWNRQMMFLNGYQRLSECHAILADNSAKLSLYDAIVQASVSWFQSEWQSTTGGGQPCYVWQYAPGHAGGNEEMNGHAAYDMWGLGRAFSAGKYGMTQTLLRPFAETLRYVIYQGNNTFAEWVNGDTSSTRNYIYPEWMPVAAYDPCIFATMANADVAQGSQGSNPIYDAFILWVKNNRALGVFANNCDAADFALSSSWVETVTPGNNAQYPVTVNALDGFASAVTLSMSGLPSGISASFTSGNNSTLTLTASGSVTPGVYSAAINGAGGGITRTVPVTMVVPSVPDFSISATPSSQGVVAGGSTTYTVNVSALDGFSGNVSLSASGLPTGSSAGFNPTSIATSGSSTLTITTSGSTPTGSYTVTITGTSGGLTHTTMVTLAVNDFTISAAPSSQTVTAGNSTNYTVTVGNVNGFNGTVTFSASGLPTGATAAFNPTSVASLGTSTLTITTGSSTASGTYTVTVTGTSGSRVHSTTVTLVINAASGGLPSGWSDADVGTPSIAGSASYSTGVFTIKGSGADIYGTADQFHFAYESVSGDQTIIDRVVSQTGANAWAKSGVMIRESTAAGASYVGLYVTPGNGVSMQYRNGTGVSATDLARQTGLSAPYWVKLMRSGNTFTGYSSANGSTWTQVGTISVTMASAVKTGVPVCSHDNTVLNTATIDNVSVTTQSGDSNVAPSGTAFGWSGMTSSTANTSKAALPGLNDNNLTVNVDIQPNGDSVNAWEAAGVTWSSAKSISSVDFINGDITSGGDGFLTANLKLQFSADGSTWADSGWTVSPAYPYSSSAGGRTYTFSGTAVSGKLGARVIGQVRTVDTSYHWIVKEVQIIGH
jgi:hypothetical protein